MAILIAILHQTRAFIVQILGHKIICIKANVVIKMHTDHQTVNIMNKFGERTEPCRSQKAINVMELQAHNTAWVFMDM